MDCFGRTTRETFNVLRDSAPSVLGAPIYGTRSEWPWEDDELIVKRPDLPRTKSELCFARMTCMLPCRASIVLSSEQLFAVFPFFLYIQIHKCDIYIYSFKESFGMSGIGSQKGDVWGPPQHQPDLKRVQTVWWPPEALEGERKISGELQTSRLQSCVTARVWSDTRDSLCRKRSICTTNAWNTGNTALASNAGNARIAARDT